jgi:branched-chain amino acid transport system ATP-binding protein
MAIFTAAGVRKTFSGIRALDGVSLEVNSAEVVGLVGPNGSGKTTFMNAASAFERADSGTFTFLGTDLVALEPWAIARLGIARTFQLPRLPARMNALELVRCAISHEHDLSVLRSFCSIKAIRRREEQAHQQAQRMLEFLGLGDCHHLPANKLSGGQQKLLTIGIALAAEPRLMLLDEPTAGVHPRLKPSIGERLVNTARHGAGILLIEHDLTFVTSWCDRVYVLDQGRLVAECIPDELTQNEAVIEAYLGEGSRPPSRHVQAVDHDL